METLYEVWERYKSMLRQFPNHGFEELMLVHIFRNGLQQQPKLLLDSTTGGLLMSKSANDAITIIKRITLNDNQGQYNTNSFQKEKLSTINDLLVKNKFLTYTMNELTNNMLKLPQQLKEMHEMPQLRKIEFCKLYSGDHTSGFYLPLMLKSIM